MLASILATGLALGGVYALIGVTYNVMFSASRVMSFTSGSSACWAACSGRCSSCGSGCRCCRGWWRRWCVARR